MRLVKITALAAALSLVFAASSQATEIVAEHVTGGHLDLHWAGGFATPNAMYAKTLDETMPGFANPSGDHTVAVAQNASPDSGGIIVTSTNPGAFDNDYVWEAYMFTGAGESRRGLILRADPSNDFESFYMLVVEPGLFQIRFRKIVAGAPTTLASWFATVLPTQSIPQDTWHKLKVIAQGNSFRCFFDDFELTTAPIVDSDIASGWVGVYNFRFDLGNVPVYFDDLVLSCVSSTTVDLEFDPRSLNLRSCGRWVEAKITPPAPFTANDIDVSSIRLNGKVPVDSTARVEIEHGGKTLGVKFRRADVLLVLPPGDAVPVRVTGLLAGGCFEGDATVRVKTPKIHHPHHGDVLSPGAPIVVDWDMDEVTEPTVAILVSFDDGANWDLLARDLPNTGSYTWTVPAASTSTARIAVAQIESVDPTDPTGYTVTGTLGVSEAFTINGVLSVPGASADFALRSIGNPSTGALRVSYSLPSNEPAALEVFDVTGRQLSSRQVGGMGPGFHSVKLAEWMPPGMYVVRLSQAGRSMSTRIAVVR
jgi:hypothetical protein